MNVFYILKILYIFFIKNFEYYMKKFMRKYNIYLNVGPCGGCGLHFAVCL